MGSASLAAPGCVLALAATLAACGGGSTSSATSASTSGCAARASEAAKAAKAVPPLQMPDGAIDVGKLQGKSVWIVDALPIPALADIGRGFEQAAKAAGMKPTVINTNGSVSAWDQAITQAVGQGADGIVLLAVPWEVVKAPVAKAAAKGIPVVQYSDGGPENKPPDSIYSHITFDSLAGGRQMADWVLADSSCDADVGFFNPVPASPQPIVEGFEKELSALCPSCKLTKDDVPIATMSTHLPSATQSMLRRNPGIDYVVPAYDSLVTFIAPSVAQAASKAKIVAHDGAPANLKALTAGTGQQVADVALAPSGFQGWLLLDQLSRGMLGMPAAAEPPIVPTRLVDRDNAAASLDELFPEHAGYQERFKRLWGLS
jgi:ribose transport system substrate-binding protein